MNGTENAKAILLSAGQGSRLLPLTKDKPKCLLEIGGQSMLAWQIEALQLAGVSEVVVVAGFRHELVERHIGELNPAGMTVRAHYNPFFQAGDNLSTCWLIRQEFSGHCLLINGDTLFSADLCRSLLAAPERPMTVTIDRKDGYDEDDMKVSLDGHYLLDIGKTLEADVVNGEAIGMIRMLGEGCAAFQSVLDHQIRTDNGLKKWYLSAVQELAQRRQVFYHSIEGMSWGEVDDKKDLAAVEKLVSKDSFLTTRAAVA